MHIIKLLFKHIAALPTYQSKKSCMNFDQTIVFFLVLAQYIRSCKSALFRLHEYGQSIVNFKLTFQHESMLVQTEAERRRREAGVKQSMEIRVRSCMYMGGWVGGWVCMVFGIISRTKARSATNEIPKCRSRERALLRHHIIGV